MPKSKRNSFRYTHESRLWTTPKPLVVDDVNSLIGSHPQAKSRGLYSSIHHYAPASTCGLPRSSIEWRQRCVSPEVFCRPAYTMVASSATLVKEKSIYQEKEDDESDVESSSEDTAFTGLAFLPTARFTAGLPDCESSLVDRRCHEEQNIRVVPAEVHAVRPVPGTHCRASVILRKNSFMR
jgi:hypothetical protein